MRVYSIVFRNKSSHAYREADYTMRIEDDIVAFRFGVANTTNASLASYIAEHMKTHFEVSFEDHVNPKDLVVDVEEESVDDEIDEEVEEEPVVVDAVKPKRRKRRRIK